MYSWQITESTCMIQIKEELVFYYVLTSGYSVKIVYIDNELAKKYECDLVTTYAYRHEIK